MRKTGNSLVNWISVFLLFVFTDTYAASRYFKSGATTWNNANNWSATSSAGVDNAGVPTSADIAYFDAGSGSCSIDVNVNVLGINTSGYTGTITQNAFTITVGSGGLAWVSGAFVGSSSAITLSNNFVQTGGTFTSTSGTFQVGVAGFGAYSFDITAGIFNHNNGLVKMSGANHSGMRNLVAYPLWNLELSQCGTCQNVGTVYVDNDFTNTSTSISGGVLTVVLKGNYTSVSGNSNIQFVGSNNQQITGPDIRSFLINKIGGSVKFNNDVTLRDGDWTHTAGTIDWNNKKLIIAINNNTRTITNGSFYDLEIACTTGVGVATAGTNPIVTHNLICNGAAGFSSFPQTSVAGNISYSTANGNIPVVLNGTGAQTISGATGGGSITINKSAGTASLANNFTLSGGTIDFNMVAGTFDQGAFTLTIGRDLVVTGGTFNGSASNITCGRKYSQSGGIFTSTSGTLQVGPTGSNSVYSVDITGGIFNHNSGLVKLNGSNHNAVRNLATYPLWNFEINTCSSCDSGGTVYIDNNLTVTNSTTYSGTSYNFSAYVNGNYICTSGAPHVTFTGSGNQTVTGPSIGSVTINKSGGTLTFNNDLTASGHWNHVGGSIVWNNHKLTSIVNFNTATITNGSFYDLTIQNTGSGINVASAGVPPNVSHNLIFNGGTGTGSFPPCTVQGDVTFNAYNNSHGTMTTLTLNGSGTQTLTAVGTSACSAILNINKTSGTAILASNLIIGGAGNDLVVIKGELNLNGYNLTVPDLLTIDGKLKLKGNENITVNSVANSVAVTNPKFTINTSSSTVEFIDSTVTAVLTKYSKSYYNLILGASKTHEVATGVGNGITVNGTISSAGTSGTQSILRSFNDTASTWELTFTGSGSSVLENKVDVKYSTANAPAWALGSQDSGNNTNWYFTTYPAYTWTGADSANNTNWSNTLNWSTGVVPGVNDVATFVGDYSVNCTVDVNIDVKGIKMLESYAGTISQGAATINVRGSHFIVSGGTFVGSASAITMTNAGEFRQEGGAFTATSGTMTHLGFVLDGGTFNANNGTLTGTTYRQSAGTFNGGTGPFTSSTFLQTGGTFNKTTNTLTCTTITESGGSFVSTAGNITASGAFLQSSGSFTSTSNTLTCTTMTISGGTFDGSSGSITLSSVFSQTGGSFTSTSGTLQVPSTNGVTVFGITGGNFIHNNGTIQIASGATTPWITTSIGQRLYNLTIVSLTGIFGTIYVDGNFNVGTLGTFSNGTLVYLKGDYLGTLTNDTGTGIITFNGTGDQNFTATKAPNVVLDKVSGNLIIGSNKNIGRNWTHTKGSISWGSFGVTIDENAASVIASGSFYDLTLNNGNGFTLSGNDCIVSHNLNLNNVASLAASTFNFKVGGNVDFTDAAYTKATAAQKIILNGAGAQNITGAGVCGLNLEINKSAGVATLGANLSVPNANSDVIITAGDLYLNGYNITVARNLTVNAKLSLKGNETITVNSIVAPATNASFAINTGSTVEFKDSAVTGVVTNVAYTFHHLILGASKTHEFGTGGANRVTVNGTLSSSGNSATRSILRALSDASTAWEFKLNGSSSLTNNVNVKYSDASSGNLVMAMGSVDSGNNINWAFNTVVSSVTSSKANGSYKAGVVIPITVNFNVSVTVTGTPTITLETGGTDQTINYVSGSGTSALLFNYTVQAGDTSLDLDYVATNSLSLNGGTIKNVINDDASLTLPAPGATNSLGANKSIVIDNTAPTITSITSSTANGSYKSGSNISVRLNFSEPVTVTGTLGVNLDSGGVAIFNAFTGTTATGTYTVGAGQTSADLTATSITVNATACDAAFNNLNTALPGTNIATGSNIIIDTTSPTITSITSSTANGTYGIGANISIRLNFSESITLVGTMGVNLDSGGICVINAFTGTTVTGTYTVVSGNSSSDLNVSSITINSTARDAALNNLNTSLPVTNIGTGSNIVIDGIPPIITSITSSTASGYYDVGANISIRLNFSKSITLTGTIGVNLDSGGVCVITGFTGTTAVGTYTVQANQNSSYLICNSISVTGTALDIALNPLSTTVPIINISNNFIYYKTHTINSSAGAGSGYQVKLTVYYGAGVDSGGDVYLNSKCQADFDDVYFTNSDQSVFLSYWLEEKVDSNYAIYWVKINNNISTSNTTIYLMYGNTNISSRSNPQNTFLFFDDFSNGLGQWTQEVVNGTIQIPSGQSYVRIGGGTGGTPYGFSSLGSSSSYTGFANNSVRLRARTASNSISEVAIRGDFVGNTGFKARFDSRTGEGHSLLKPPYVVGGWNFLTGNLPDGQTPTADTWYVYEFSMDGSDMKWYRNNTLRRSATDASYSGPGEISLQNHYGSYTDFDWVFVRKYITAEPAHGAWGSEVASNLLGNRIGIDTTTPTITSITSSTANGNYKAGANISIRINFSEQITLTGTMGINLDSGGVCVINAFTGTTATGTYTVLSGQNSLDLTASSITVNTSAKDIANKDLVTTLPVTNIATGSNIVIDTTAPTISSITSSTTNGSYKAGANISIRINFSEAITLTGTMGINLDSGGVCVIGAFTGTTATGTYTVLSGHNSSDLTASSVTVNTTARDASLNNLNTALPGTNIATGSNIVIDTTVPTISSITSSTANGSYKAGDNISIRINFSEAITLTGTMGINLDSGGVCVINAFTGTTATGTYTVLAGHSSSDLTASSITVNTTARDAALNNLNTALPATNIATGSNIVIDTTAPTITSITSSTANGSYKAGANISIRINFSEAITLTGTMGINLDSGGVCVINAFTGTTATGTYTVLAGHNSSDLTASSITVNTTARDAALNNLSTTLPSTNIATGSNIVIDTTAPTITSITSSTADGSYKAGANISIRINFSEAITLTGTMGINLDSGGVCVINAFTGTTATGTYTVLAGHNSSDLTASSITVNTTAHDAALNNLNTALPTTNIATNSNIVIDTTVPTITSITSSIANGNYKAGANISIRINFSEPITLTGTMGINLDSGGVCVINAFTGTTATGTYTVLAGHNSSDLTASSITINTTARDVALNNLSTILPSTNIATGSNIIIDTTAPTITSITSSTANGNYKAGANISIRINFSEAITLTGTLGINLDSGGVCVINAFTGTTATGTYTVLAGHNSSDLTASSITVNTTARDAALNNLSTTLPSTNIATGSNIVIDTTSPTITSITSSTANGSYGVGANISIRINFSESITLTGTLGINLDSGGVCVINAFTGTTATGTYTVLAGHNSADLTATSIAVNTTARDAALNNLNTALPTTNIATGSNIVINTNAPSITSITSSTADGAYTTGANISIRLNFSSAITLTGTMNVSLDSGGSCVINAFTGTTVVGIYTVLAGHNSSDLTVSSVTVNGTAQDSAFNNLLLALPGTNIATNSNIVIDTTAPAITSILASSLSGYYNAGDTINITISFSEIVTLSSGTLSVNLTSGGSISFAAFSGTQASGVYTVLNGENTLTLNATACSLSAGTLADVVGIAVPMTIPATNISPSKTIVVDTTAPTISSSALGSASTFIDITLSEGVYTNIAGTGSILTTDFNLIFNQNGGTATGVTITSITKTTGGALTGGESTLRLMLSVSGTLAGLETITITPNSNEVYDRSGNPALNTTTTGAITLSDLTSPTVTNVTSTKANGSYKASTVIDITITFSEAVTVNGTPQLLLKNGGAGRNADYQSGSTTNTLTFRYTVINGDTASDLDYTATTSLSLNGGTIKDTSNNNATLILPTPGTANSLGSNKNIVIDTIAPTLDSGTLEASNAYVDISFSEGVYTSGSSSALTAADLDVLFAANGGSATNVTITSLSSITGGALIGGEDKVRAILSVNGSVSGLETITIQPGSNKVFDKAGNFALTTPNTGVIKLFVTGTTPTITNVYGISADGSYNAGKTVTIAVTFSEEINVTGIPYLVLETGTTDQKAFYTEKLNANTMLFVYTVEAGDSSNDLDYNSAISLASGANLIKSTKGINASLTLPNPGTTNSLAANSNIKIDTILPVINSITTSQANGVYGSGVLIPVKINLNRPVSLSGGSMFIQFNSGATVTITDIANTAVINVDYLVQNNEHANDLDISAITLSSGASIKDELNNDLNLSFESRNISLLHDIEIYTQPFDYMLTITSGDNGSVSPSGVLSVFAGTSKRINIIPKPGYHIENVLIDGESVGARASYTFNDIQANHSIHATFAENTGSFNIISFSNGGGSLTQSGTISVLAGDSLTIGATAEENFYISDVLVDGRSVGAINNYTFTDINQSHTFQVIFANVEDYFKIVSNATNGGSISPLGFTKILSSGSQSYTIEASSGYHIRDVFVDNQSVGAVSTYDFTSVSSHHRINAIFEKTKSVYLITATTAGGGTISPSGISKVTAGESKEFKFTPNAGYHVAMVVIDGIPKGRLSSYTFNNVNEDHSLQVIYQLTKEKYSVVTSTNTGGKGVQINRNSIGDIVSGNNTMFTITAETGYSIVTIKINGFSIEVLNNLMLKIARNKKLLYESSVSFTLEDIQEDIIVEAEVTNDQDTYLVLTNINGNGSIDLTTPATVAKGSDVFFTITPDTGHHIAEVIIDGDNYGAMQFIYLDNIASDAIVDITFAKNQSSYLVKAGAWGKGAISPTGDISVNADEDLSFTFTANEGYQLTDIIIDGNSIKDLTRITYNEGYTFEDLNRDHSINAVFTPVSKYYKVTTTANLGGQVSKLGVTTVKAGDNYICEIIPDTGFHISNVSIDDQSIGAVSAIKLDRMDNNHKVNVVFTQDLPAYGVEVISNEGGSVNPEGVNVVTAGDSFVLDIQPESAYRVMSVSINGTPIGSPSQLLISNVQSNYQIQVEFISKTATFVVAEKLIGAGRIESLNNVSVSAGGSITSVYPTDNDVTLIDVVIDGISYGAITTYTFTDINTDHTIVYVVESNSSLDKTSNDPSEPSAGGCSYSAFPANNQAPEWLFLLLLTIFITRIVSKIRLKK